MSPTRQVPTDPAGSGRVRQKLRTRKAILDAAVAILRQGRQPSIPEVADAALVSTATAYRYFASAQALWEEASIELVVDQWDTSIVDDAGTDPVDRLDVVVRTLGWHMFDEELPFRNLARHAIDRWFDQASFPESEHVPVREARRLRWNAKVIEPLRGQVPDPLLDDLLGALTLVWGTDALLALRDAARLDPEDAKRVMSRAARWMLEGALAEAGVDREGDQSGESGS